MSIEVAEGYFELGMPLEAWEALDALPTELKESPQVLAFSVRIYLAMGKLETARVIAEELTRSYPDTMDSWVALARVEAKSGRIKEAMKSLKECIRFEETFCLAIMNDPEFKSLP